VLWVSTERQSLMTKHGRSLGQSVDVPSKLAQSTEGSFCKDHDKKKYIFHFTKTEQHFLCLYLTGARFKSRPGHLTIATVVFHGFPQTSMQMSD
jgi:hypothetical protein